MWSENCEPNRSWSQFGFGRCLSGAHCVISRSLNWNDGVDEEFRFNVVHAVTIIWQPKALNRTQKIHQYGTHTCHVLPGWQVTYAKMSPINLKHSISTEGNLSHFGQHNMCFVLLQNEMTVTARTKLITGCGWNASWFSNFQSGRWYFEIKYWSPDTKTQF